MNTDILCRTARQMVASGRGILAMDESHPTCEKRFKQIGVKADEANRCQYRSMLVTATDLGKHIAGVILFDETIRQDTSDGVRFAEQLEADGIVPGIKVDKGAKSLAACPGEKITEGLDGLRERLAEYQTLGARFAKWRAVITIGDNIPSDTCIQANAHALARYAALCQEFDIVPIVEPEVLMDGAHTIERCYAVTKYTQSIVFNELRRQRVELSGVVLKPNMIVSGSECPQQAGADEVARMTLQCLLNTVPAAVPGIAFLSGGLGDEAATANLNAINVLARERGNVPWHITFSYGRALQQKALKVWAGQAENMSSAQQAISQRAKLNGLASTGDYDAGMEHTAE